MRFAKRYLPELRQRRRVSSEEQAEMEKLELTIWYLQDELSLMLKWRQRIGLDPERVERLLVPVVEHLLTATAK